MRTIDEMLHLDLLTQDQHHAINAWIGQARSPDDILQMPRTLWHALERASAAMGVPSDLLQPPALDARGLMLDSPDEGVFT